MCKFTVIHHVFRRIISRIDLSNSDPQGRGVCVCAVGKGDTEIWTWMGKLGCWRWSLTLIKMFLSAVCECVWEFWLYALPSKYLLRGHPLLLPRPHKWRWWWYKVTSKQCKTQNANINMYKKTDTHILSPTHLLHGNHVGQTVSDITPIISLSLLPMCCSLKLHFVYVFNHHLLMSCLSGSSKYTDRINVCLLMDNQVLSDYISPSFKTETSVNCREFTVRGNMSAYI